MMYIQDVNKNYVVHSGCKRTFSFTALYIYHLKVHKNGLTFVTEPFIILFFFVLY